MNNSLCKEAGERICSIRKAKGYTRDRLSEKTGISSKFLYEVEKGKKKFSAEALGCIAKALDVSCDYILLGNDVEESIEKELVEMLILFDREQQKKLIPLLKFVYQYTNE